MGRAELVKRVLVGYAERKGGDGGGVRDTVYVEGVSVDNATREMLFTELEVGGHFSMCVGVGVGGCHLSLTHLSGVV